MSTLNQLLDRRELLWNLTLRDLRGRYKRSVLGWAWSLLNPIAFMLIYSFAFGLVLDADPPPGRPSGLESYPLWLMCGFLPWNFFLATVTTGMQTIVVNGALVRKVAFPREHLVLSTVIAGLFTFGVEFVVLAVALTIAGNFVLVWIPLVLVTAFLLAVMTTGVALALAAGTVFFRDLNYLWAIAGQALFFATPIVYPARLVADRVTDKPWIENIYDSMPLAVVIRMFRNMLFDLRMPQALDFVILAGYAAVALAVGWWVFRSAEDRFAEEL